MEESWSVFFVFFPMIGELHRRQWCDVPILPLRRKYPIEAFRGAEQADMPTMQRGEWPATNVALFGKK